MIKGTKNQLHNISNPYQGDTKKVLAVCSAGLLRSATLQNFLIKEYGYNVRNCGTEASYALIPISEALIKWADEIVFVNMDNYYDVKIQLDEMNIDKNKIFILNIPDQYGFNNPALINIIKEQYTNKQSLAFNLESLDKLT
jgi:predicted protein tyrosine phosphatase